MNLKLCTWRLHTQWLWKNYSNIKTWINRDRTLCFIVSPHLPCATRSLEFQSEDLRILMDFGVFIMLFPQVITLVTIVRLFTPKNTLFQIDVRSLYWCVTLMRRTKALCNGAINKLFFEGIWPYFRLDVVIFSNWLLLRALRHTN